MFPSLPRALAGVGVAALLAVACKPSRSGSKGSSASNVFDLPPGEYSFVRGSLRVKGTRPEEGLAALAKGGTGKLVTVSSRGGGVMQMTYTGKYGWRAGNEPEVNVDCAASPDEYVFPVYTVVEGTGRLGRVEAKRGCKLEPEPDARQEWTPVAITPREGGEFLLSSETVHKGKALVLEETYRVRAAGN